MGSLFTESKCYNCKRTFINSDSDQWIYRAFINNGHRIFCSWGCLQEARRKQEERKKKKKDEK